MAKGLGAAEFAVETEVTAAPYAQQGGVKPPQSKALRAAQPVIRGRFD